LEQYFEVNEIANEKRVPALLSSIGGKTYTLLRNWTTPDKPKDKSYADIVICYVFITGVSDRKRLYRLAFYSTLIKNSHDTVCIVNIRDWQLTGVW
jgi:hypothetical protein